jgi:hypothetical protein
MRPRVGTLTCPHDSDRATQIYRLSASNVLQFQPNHLAAAQTRLAAQRDDQLGRRFTGRRLNEPLELLELVEPRFGSRPPKQLDRARDLIDAFGTATEVARE